jgi:hypothetical protein
VVLGQVFIIYMWEEWGVKKGIPEKG